MRCGDQEGDGTKEQTDDEDLQAAETLINELTKAIADATHQQQIAKDKKAAVEQQVISTLD